MTAQESSGAFSGRIACVLVRPPRTGDVVSVALNMGADVLFIERVVGLENSPSGFFPAPYDRICIGAGIHAYRETFAVVIEAARSGCMGDGKMFLPDRGGQAETAQGD